MATKQDLIVRFTKAFDHHDPEYTPEIAEIVNSTIREGSAVAYSPAYGGMWILSRYEDVKAALKDYRTFSSASGVHFPRAEGMPKFSPIDYDPPEQAVRRKLMAPPMDKEAVRRLESAARKLASELIEPIVRRGHGDLLAELARPFAIRSLALAIGLTESAQRQIRELTHSMWKRLSKDKDATRFWPAFRTLLSEELTRARDEPGDYYLSHLVRSRVDGEPISDDMLYSILVSFCVAGHDNPMNSISRLLWYLARNTPLQLRLKAEPGLMSGVAEETLRRWCPADRLTRVTTRDVTIGGVTIPRGSRVVLLFDAANRDPKKFPEPDEVQPERANSRDHVSFGYGLHFCMGAHLTRMEFNTLLAELAQHPVYELTEEPRRHFENGRHIVFEKLPVRFDTTAATPNRGAA
jgi:cytochrome P450